MLGVIEARLQPLVPEHLNRVETALELAAVMDRPPQAGVAAWVVPLAERPEGTKRLVGPALQKVDLLFGVVIAVRSVNDPRGTQGNDQLDAARQAVREQLFGWQPGDSLLPILMAPSDLIKMEKSTIWWIDRYTTAIQRRAYR